MDNRSDRKCGCNVVVMVVEEDMVGTGDLYASPRWQLRTMFPNTAKALCHDSNNC
jgi:hypothetical protein